MNQTDRITIKEVTVVAIYFHCSDCNAEVLVALAIWEDNELQLVGKCTECEIIVRFSTDAMISAMMKKHFVRTPKGQLN